jgi:hypothetical protein
MTKSSNSSLDLLDVFGLRRLDELGDRYEAERRAGVEPDLALLFGGVAEPLRHLLLLEVVQIERELAREAVQQRPRGNWSGQAVVTESNSAAVANPVTDRMDVGRFQPLELHRRGGRGRVWRAFDRELNRPVALKDLDPQEALDPALQQRFFREAQITGALEHGGVVPVYGLGRQADGTPFYAMRFITGESLRETIRRFHEQSVNGGLARFQSREFRHLLGRFLAACDTIEFAHSRGVIHRDLKPDNIMIADYGETLVVDWGLAKLTTPVGSIEQEKDDRSEHSTASAPATQAEETAEGVILGTPAYMSPEQAAGQLDLLGPATDVYSLGTTLYLLLTGQAAFSGTREQILQAVEAGSFVAPRNVTPRIPRSLEAICLKAMEPMIADRYQSVRALAGDLERWLADEPIGAYCESWSERFSRWSRRRRAYVRAAVASLIVVTLAALTAAIFIDQSREQEAKERQRAEMSERLAMEAQRRAESNERLASVAQQRAERDRREAIEARNRETLQRKEAELAEQRLRATANYLVSVFDSADPLGLRGLGLRSADEDARPLSAVDLLRRGVDRLDEELGDEPLVRAHILDSLGAAFLGQGELDQAQQLLDRATALRDDQLTEDHPDRLSGEWNLALLKLVRSETQDAERRLRAVLARQQQNRLPPLTIARTQFYLALALKELYRGPESLAQAEAALAVRQRELGSRHPDTVLNRMLVLDLLSGLDRTADAMREAKILAEAVDPLTAFTLATAAVRYSRMEQHRLRQEFAPALEICEQLIRDAQRIFGTRHALTRVIESQKFLLVRQQGKLRAAEEYGRQLFEQMPRVLARSPRASEPLFHLASLIARRGDTTRAEFFYRQAMSAGGAVYVKENAWGLKAALELAALLRDRGELLAAEQLIHQSLEQIPLEREYDRLAAQAALIAVLLAQGKTVDAAQSSVVLDLESRRFLDRDPVVRLDMLRWRLESLRALGDFSAAREVDAQALELAQRLTVTAEDGFGADRAFRVAEWLQSHGDWEGTDKLHQLALREAQKRQPNEHPDVATIYFRVATWYQRSGRLEDARRWYEECLDLRQRLLGPDHLETEDTQLAIAQLWRDQGDERRARELVAAVLAARRSRCGQTHRATWRAMLVGIEVFGHLGQDFDSLQMLEELWNIQNVTLHRQDSRLDDLRLRRIDARLARQDWEAARRLLHEAESTGVAAGPHSAWLAVELQRRRGELLQGEKQWEAAQRCLEEAYLRTTEIWSPSARPRREAIAALIRYYEQVGSEEARLQGLREQFLKASPSWPLR